MIIPNDLKNIIVGYVNDLEMHDIRKTVFDEINNIRICNLSLCRYCRCIKIIDDENNSKNYNIDNNCPHFFHLVKNIHYLNNNHIFRDGLFNFHCAICNTYDNFFNHLHD